MTLAAFRQALEKDGLKFDRFREEIRNEIMITRLREREVDDKIQVSDSEIDLYIAEAEGPGAPVGDVEYNFAHVLLRLPEQATPENIQAARARAEKVIAEAKAGADFARLAASYSDAPDALTGGNMGWRSHDRLPEVFAAALKDLRPGEVTPVLRSPAGFHVLKLLDRRGGALPLSAAPVQQTHVRHILIKTNEVVSESDARRRLADLRERIVNGGDFAEFARLHSDDSTAAKGGDLDWVYKGDTVPEFERAMDALKPGEISQPVKSPFGYHLIQVLERRVADVSVERRRLQARQALRERRADEAYQDWLRQLRDRTYVEIRLEDK
jgi:peptidyl-prolyl cis-trans isomerase SurA